MQLVRQVMRALLLASGVGLLHVAVARVSLARESGDLTAPGDRLFQGKGMVKMSDLAEPAADEIEYMRERGLWEPFAGWTPLQRSLYLEQIRGRHNGLPFSERARRLGVDSATLRREAEALWGVLLWDRSKADPVPCHRD